MTQINDSKKQPKSRAAKAPLQEKKTRKVRQPMKAAPAKMGRPTTYNEAFRDAFCERVAAGESVRSICRDDDYPEMKTIFRWLSKHEDFRHLYDKAKEMAMMAMAEEIMDIADDGRNDTYVDEEGRPRVDTDVIQRSRLRVDTRKWLMSKLAPKKYGDKVDLNHGAQPDNPLTMLFQQVAGTPFKPSGD